jgi:glycosyltransferase involved in cell wall biosynthesis
MVHRHRVPGDSGKLGVLLVTTPTRSPLGADTWIHTQIISTLDRATHDVHVACVVENDHSPTPAFEAIRDMPDVSVHPVDFGRERFDATNDGRMRHLARSLRIVPSILRTARLIRREDISIIHTTDRPRDALVSVVLGRISRAQSIIHVHVVFREWIRGPLKWALRRADALVGVSVFVADSLVEGGHSRAKTFAALNAIDIDRWHPGEGREAIRAEFGVSDNETVVLCACRLFPEKGARELIRAIADVRVTHSHVRLWIVGDDVSQDHQYRTGLEELVTELQLGDTVTLSPRRGDMPRVMAGADVFAMPSFEEPFGLVFAEAMAMRIPVVALDNGGTKEVVIHGETGLLSPPGDHERLVAHLLTLLDDPGLRARMGDAGRSRVEQHFRMERLASNVAQIYRVVSSARSSEGTRRTGASDSRAS